MKEVIQHDYFNFIIYCSFDYCNTNLYFGGYWDDQLENTIIFSSMFCAGFMYDNFNKKMYKEEGLTRPLLFS